SLFGIALLLSLMAYYHLNPEMLFYNDLVFEEYCESVALNYQDKLPLVFGKWNSIAKKSLGLYTITPEILQRLFYDHTRNAMIETSVTSGGVKEYYEGVDALSFQTLKLGKIHESGVKVLEQLDEFKDHYSTGMLSQKLDEIYNSLRQRDLLK